MLISKFIQFKTAQNLLTRVNPLDLPLLNPIAIGLPKFTNPVKHSLVNSGSWASR